MSEDLEQAQVAVDTLVAAENNPMMIFKAAFSRLPAILLIGSGIIFNIILALLFVVRNITVLPFTTTLITFLVLMFLFPAGYLYAAYKFGQEAFIYDLYREVIRPVLGNLIARVLNTILKDDNTATNSANIEEAVKKEGGSFLDKIPEFIKNRLAIFTVIKDVIKLATDRYQNGASKETAKSNIVAYVFELLDGRMETIANPSLKPFFIMVGINIVALGYIF
ncbi:MAG: Unknown protein [uncultured Aureispira sp.]|uniref:Uncharacterized protein n=1 Tax=uncultured Aureispira sp. TaxID=1331704 RepID=A0A6S6SH79_9BACT|nr:MAG: Unknown protein [uncultured Aureispira sp.]